MALKLRLAESNFLFRSNADYTSKILALNKWLAESNDTYLREWLDQSNRLVLWLAQSNTLYISNVLHQSNLVFLSTNWTAFKLIANGNTNVPTKSSKDQIVAMESVGRSRGEVMPRSWKLSYYDEARKADATAVYFEGGVMTKVSAAGRIIENGGGIFGKEKPFDRSKLKIDSDKLLEIIRNQPQARDLNLLSTRMELKRESGIQPVWEVEVWVERQRQPGDECSLGRIKISAETGKIISSDLNRERTK